MTLVAAPERLADPARERLRRDHARAVEKLLRPVEDAFARAVLRILRAALARVSPALVAAGDQFDLAGLEGLGAAWEREVPELAAQLHDVYGAGVLGAQQQFPQAWARAQAADATATATMNERALDFLGTASNRLVQVDDAMWGRVRDQLQQGIAAGEGIPQMQTRVRDTLESTELRARTIARTEAVGALNRGSIDGVQSLGGYAPAFKEWLCVSGDSRVAGRITRLARRWERGPLLTIHTRTPGGFGCSSPTDRRLTVTPNHPCLTGRGWVAADEIEPGDHLIGSAFSQGNGCGKPNEQGAPPKISEAFRAAQQGGPTERMVTVVPYLDGEARESEVEVVTVHGELRDRLESPLHELFSEDLLAKTDVELPPLAGCSTVQRVRVGDGAGVAAGPDGRQGVGALHLPTVPASFGLPAFRNVAEPQDTFDRGLAAPEVAGQVVEGCTSEVAAHEVFSVEVKWGGHWVYDAETEVGWFIANGKIVHNSTQDERTRETHLDADGQRVGTDDTFTVGDSQLAYPGDESGPAEEVINCRCSLIYTDEPPEGEEAPTPPTDDTEAQGEPAPEAELTIEPPPTTLDPADQARAEIHSLRDEYEAATRELRGVDPADGSPNRLNPDDHYRYTRPEEVREYDQVVIGDSRYNVLSPTDEAGEMKVAALRGEPDEGFIGRRPWTDVDEVYQRNGSGMRFKLDDPEGRAERAASRVGARVDDEVQRRLELDGIHPPNPGIELDREAVQAAHRDLWEQQDAIYQRIRDEVRHADPDLRLGEQINRARELTRQDPEWVRLDGERDSLFRQLRDGNPFDRQMIAYRDEYARVLRNILDETRGVGGASLDITGSRPAQEMARVAERVYPREWIESSNNAGGLKVERSGNRAYYSHYDPAGPRLVQNGAPGSGYGQEVTVHEFGHRMEYTRDDITELERQFYERRTGGEDLKRLRDVTGNRAYDTRELTREDKFADAYMGKQYGTSKESPWELFTMGMQSVASPEVSDQATRWVVKLFAEDSDYIRWLIGVLFVA